jgi:hypothetical protein
MNQNVIRKIIDVLDIDTRLQLGLLPRRLDVSPYEHLLPRPEYIYHAYSKTLFQFGVSGHVIYTPISVHEFGYGTIFNLYCKEYLAHVYGNCGCYYLHVRPEMWMTKLKVKMIHKQNEDKNT